MSTSNNPIAERLEPPRSAGAVESDEPLATSASRRVHVWRPARSNTTASHRDRGHLSRSSLWKRVWRPANRAAKGLLLTPMQNNDGDMWKKVGTVAIPTDDGHEKSLATTIKLDSGCEKVNLISTRLMRKVGVSYNNSTGVDIGTFVDGKRCQSLGEVEVRWYTEGYDMVFEDATCHVVDSGDFELLIGKVDIDRLQLFKPNRGRIGRISALFPARPKVKVKSIPKQDDAAKTARMQEKEEKARQENEEEEKARRAQHK